MLWPTLFNSTKKFFQGQSKTLICFAMMNVFETYCYGDAMVWLGAKGRVA
jgi:hypothetical protein